MNDYKIIYIIGAGRSGTTLLDIILGNAGNGFSVGELNRFTKRNGIPHSARDADVSSFWQQINEQLIQNGFKEPRYYYKISARFEYHSSFRRLFFYNKKEFNCYRNYQHALFSAIAAASDKNFNKNIIIDSSKYPLRAYFLSKIFGRNISFIYIQRNPLAVVKSFQRKDIEQPSKNRYSAHSYLFAVNNLSRIIIKLLKKKHSTSFVSYESLLNNPVKALSKIENDLSVDLSIPAKKIQQNLPLNVGYLFDGNRLRLNNIISFYNSPLKPAHAAGMDSVLEKLHKILWYKSLKQ